MEPTKVNQFHFVEPKKVELKSYGFSSFSHHQILATIKSVSYLVAADNRVTNNERSMLGMICSQANLLNPGQVFEESKRISVDEMFSTLSSMSKKQKDTVLFNWIMMIQYSRDNNYNQRRFNLDLYPKEKDYLIDMARRSNIDISAFLNGPVELI